MSDKKLENAMIDCARFTAEIARTSHEKTIDQHNAAFRWLLASLFALNGGAILATINSAIVEKDALIWSSLTFFVGILATFWMAIMSQNSDRGIIAAMSVWGLYWTQVASTGTRDQSQESEIQDKIDAAEKYGRKGRISGVFSMLCFAVGCVISGVSVIK